MFREVVRPAFAIFVALSLVTGIAYPLLVTAIAQAVFPGQANGSLVYRAGKAVGSSLIGQSFDDPKYFWGRPSATQPAPYNAAASSGSNLGPTNATLADAVRRRVEALRAADPGNKSPVPVDLVTASGSGLDPHISVAAVAYQISRVARIRRMESGKIEELIRQNTEDRTFGLIGEPRVNVLKLNLALDALKNEQTTP